MSSVLDGCFVNCNIDVSNQHIISYCIILLYLVSFKCMIRIDQVSENLSSDKIITIINHLQVFQRRDPREKGVQGGRST